MSEQGQTPPPPEPSQDRAQNDPRAARPAPEQATTPLPAEAAAGRQPAPDQPAAEPPPAAAPPPPAAATPSVAVPARPGRVRRFAGHRATQVVAAGLLGLVLGGGVVGAVAADRSGHRGGPGHARVHERGDRGPDRGDRGGDRFEQRGPFGERGDRFER